MATAVRATKIASDRQVIAENWLDISTDGFAAENAGRPRPHLAKEIVQNALDAVGNDKGAKIDVSIKYDRSVKAIEFVVTDNGIGIPADDMSKIRTVFWTSKTDSVLKRGRMGRGFKEMLCLAKEASVRSATTVLFFRRLGNEQKVYKESCHMHHKGCVVTMYMPWPEVAVDELTAYFQTFLIPPNITLTVNGVKVKQREAKHLVEVSLPTEMFQDGQWVRPTRKTVVELVATRGDEKGLIHEMGIPVCDLEWDFKYHANVLQRIPMNPKRDAVQTGYSKKIHAAAIPILLPELSQEQVLSDVVGAVAPALDTQVQQEIIRRGFGDNVVREVPSVGKRDFNDDAQDLGFKPVNVSSLSGGLREIFREHVATAKDVVDRDNEAKVSFATRNSFSVEELYEAEVAEADMKKKLIAKLGGKAHVEKVMEFALWFTQRLLDGYGEITIGGIKLTQFADTTIATWDDDDNLSLGLNHAATWTNPLSPESLTTYVHEVGHHLNMHHGRNFHVEIERLSGRAAWIGIKYADEIRKRFHTLLP